VLTQGATQLCFFDGLPMSTAPIGKWLPQQQQRLDAFNVPRCVDIHCHCLPGLDDGPAALEESLALCQAIAEDGITTVIASPHQLGRYDRLNSANVIRSAVADLSAATAEQGIPLEILPGADVRIDERLLRLLERDDVLTVADAGYHMLLELPHELFVDPLPTIDLLRERGIQPIMTHPERHSYLHGTIDWAADWIKHGAVLQVTAGSITGEFGSRAFEHAWQLIEADYVSLIATDAHDARRRPPRMSDAIQTLMLRSGEQTTRLLAIDNPLRLVEGKPIEHPLVA
jgi:protein-tyrosine phosphatase